MKVRLAFLVVLLLSGLFSAADAKLAPPAEDAFVKNPRFEPSKVPDPEYKIDLSRSETHAKRALGETDKAAGKLCKRGSQVFRVNPAKSALKVTAFKNYKIPVTGKFKNFDGYITWNAKDAEPAVEMELSIDATSYDSGVPDRDSRVKHFLLHADEKKGAVATLKSKYRGDLKAGRKEIPAELKIRGRKYKTTAVSNVVKEGETWVIRSAEPARLKVAIPGRDFMELMALCNHESLTPVVDLEWELVLEDACKR